MTVVREGRLLLEVAAGVRGATDPRPVFPETLFPVLDLGAWAAVLLLCFALRCVALSWLCVFVCVKRCTGSPSLLCMLRTDCPITTRHDTAGNVLVALLLHVYCREGALR